MHVPCHREGIEQRFFQRGIGKALQVDDVGLPAGQLTQQIAVATIGSAPGRSRQVAVDQVRTDLVMFEQSADIMAAPRQRRVIWKILY